jgi:hypothetical protein
MKVREYEFTKDNHFIAMEYYRLILNRTFLVFITPEELIGVKVHGAIGVETAETSTIMPHIVINGNLNNPYSYIDVQYLEQIQDLDLESDKLQSINAGNFKIHRSSIAAVHYDETKKWGMGPYPHDGKVYVTTRDLKKREFIILGSQSGEHIANILKYRRI